MDKQQRVDKLRRQLALMRDAALIYRTILKPGSDPMDSSEDIRYFEQKLAEAERELNEQ